MRDAACTAWMEDVAGRIATGVRRQEELRGRLSKVGDLHLHSLPFHIVLDRLQVDSALVGEEIEQVVGSHSRGTTLLVAYARENERTISGAADRLECDGGWLSGHTKNEVDPVVQVLRHVIALQCLSLDADELLGGARPRRKHHVINLEGGVVGNARVRCMLRQVHGDTSSWTTGRTLCPLCMIPKSKEDELVKNSGR